MKNVFVRLALIAALVSLFVAIQPVLAQGTAFTYQGRLQSKGDPANGNYDFTFALFNNSSGNPPQLGTTLTDTNVGVTNGLFTVTLDFGSAFTGNATWLAIAVRTNGGVSFTALNPLQPLTPTPYALYASNANTVVGSVSASQLTSGTIPEAQLPSTIAFLNSNQNFTGQNNFSSSVGIGTTSPTSPLDVYSTNVNGAAITLNSGGFTSLIQQKSFNAPDHGLQFYNTTATITDEAFIFLNAQTTPLLTMLANGNVGIGTTTPGAQFSLGSSLADTKLALFDNGSAFFGLGIQAGQFRLHTSSTNDRFSFLTSPNGIENMTILGSGNVGIGTTNPQANLQIYGDFIGGGTNNAVDSASLLSAVAGGDTNSITESQWSFIGSGTGNSIFQCPWAFIGGGYGNSIQQGYFGDVISGGESNAITGSFNATIGGGFRNQATYPFATVPGGFKNIAAGYYSFAAGQNAQAMYQGDFVWADSAGGAFTSTANDQFLIRAAGGVGIGTTSPATTLDVAGSVHASGNVGIGTTSPQTPLHIKETSTTESGGLRLEGQGTTNFWNIHYDGGSALIFSFDHNYSRAIGYAYLNSTSYGLISVSDRRAKKDIEPMGQCLDRVMQLKPASFRYKDAPEDTPPNYGFIAQEIETVFPDVVLERNGMKTLVVDSLIAVNTQAIQDLKRQKDAEIQSQKTEIAELKTKIDRLEKAPELARLEEEVAGLKKIVARLVRDAKSTGAVEQSDLQNNAPASRNEVLAAGAADH